MSVIHTEDNLKPSRIHRVKSGIHRLILPTNRSHIWTDAAYGYFYIKIN